MKDQLDFAIHEIKSNSKSPKKHIQITEHEVMAHRVRVSENYPNMSFFTIPTGKVYGDVMQDIIIDSFSDGVKKHSGNTKYDAECHGLRLEIKSLRAINGKKNKDLYIASRIFNLADNPRPSQFSTSSFQQSKPSYCDFFVFHMLYGDSDRLFIIPSKMVSARSGQRNKEPGKLLLSKQHGTSSIEGQINLSEVIKYKRFFEIPNYSHSKKYSFMRFKNYIESNMKRIEWKLPD